MKANSNSIPQYAPRRLLSSSPSDSSSPLRSLLWLSVHSLCCLVSLVIGFRFSRLLLFLLLSHPSPQTSVLTNTAKTILHQSLLSPPAAANSSHSRVVVGRHGILVRPWPHPNPSEVLTAHAIIERVQREQRLQYGVKNPRPIIAVTPTHSRTFQSLHLTGVLHSLLLLPYPLIWIVVDASPTGSNDTASFLQRSGLIDNVIHIPFPDRIPSDWASRHQTESRMRLLALREIRERRLDGIVVFMDDSNMHSMEMFDEVQKVEWFGALSVGIIAHSGSPDLSLQESVMQQQDDATGRMENYPVPVQGPACNASGSLVGWHTFNTLPYLGRTAKFVGDVGVVLPTRLEWSGFVLNSRLLWKKDVEGRPRWVRDLSEIDHDDQEVESPLDLLKDASLVEPLGNCGKKVLLWWLRVEARLDSKFPHGWTIDPPLEITVPAKRTPWPDIASELPSTKIFGSAEKNPKLRSSRSRRGSRSKKSRDSHVDTQTSGVTQARTLEH